MNDRIKQLTRNYLNSLDLPYYSRLNDRQKQRIIEINSQSEWIIFNSGSLQAERKEYEYYGGSTPILVNERNEVWDMESSRFLNVDVFLRRRVNNLVGTYRLGEWEERNILNTDRNSPDCGQIIGTRRVRTIWGCTRDNEGRISAEYQLVNPMERTRGGFHPEYYNLTNSHLKRICQEVNNHYLKDNDEVDKIMFSGGSGIVGNSTMAAFDTDYRGQVDNSYWVAVNKKEATEQYELLNIFSVNNDRRHWKKETELDNLLNDNEITNSRERSESATPSSSSGTPPPP